MKTKHLARLALPAVIVVAVAAVPAVTGAQSYGTVSLSTGFMPDPQMLSGVAGGGMNASALGSGCWGWITPQPSHYVFLSSYVPWMRVFVRAGGDTTLVVRGPSPTMMTQCNDDRYGLNPAIEGSWSPGQYEVWVGSYASGAMHPYQIGFTEISSVY